MAQKRTQTKKKQIRYIFVIGGVMSSVGKGVTTASIGRILISKGYKVAIVKCEMYINIDAGTIRPTEHGEVFVGSDGIEADQDLGNYERFTGNISLSENYITQGQIYLEVIRRERNLEFGGEDVEVIPDIPNEIIRRLRQVERKQKPDFTIVEVGGTVGEYQDLLFLEAARMLHLKHPDLVQFVLVSYLPIPKTVGEMKTKPTQYAVRTLNSAGIEPDFIVCRSERAVDSKRKTKLSLMCNVEPEAIISAPDVDSIYEVPLILEKDNFGNKILQKFGFPPRSQDLKDWRAWVKRSRGARAEVQIGVVGKYFATGDYTLSDSYISVVESIKHAAWANNRVPRLHWINSEDFERDPRSIRKLREMDGILVPGGFGERGVEGIVMAIRYARENKIPYLGLCYGMQLAVIEFARNVCGMKGANTTEIDRKTRYPVIDVMAEQKKNLADRNFGATMRLGDYPCAVKKGTLAHEAYGTTGPVMERHRHRYEVNNKFRKVLQEKGMVFSGVYTKKDLVEISELDKKIHPWFLGTQFHPEFNSRLWKPQALFDGFVKASLKRRSRPSRDARSR